MTTVRSVRTAKQKNDLTRGLSFHISSRIFRKSGIGQRHHPARRSQLFHTSAWSISRRACFLRILFPGVSDRGAHSETQARQSSLIRHFRKPLMICCSASASVNPSVIDELFPGDLAGPASDRRSLKKKDKTSIKRLFHKPEVRYAAEENK